jgi:hypothetical protein
MKKMTAGQRRVSQADTPEGPDEWSGDGGRVGVSGTGFATTCPSDFLSPAHVHELLVSPQENLHVPYAGGSPMASDFVGETEYVPVTLDAPAGVCDTPTRTEPGEPGDRDVLRAARGIIWVTVFGVPLWSGVLLLLYWV